MSKAQETLDRIFQALKLSDEEEKTQVKLEALKTKDGVVVESEMFAEGDALFVVTEEGERVPAPEGDHTLEDGRMITVDAQGIITMVKEAGAEEEKPETTMSKDDATQPAKSIIETTSKQVNFTEVEMSEVKTKLSETETKLSAVETELSEVKSAKDELEKEKSELEAKNVQLTADLDALRKQLENEPAAKTNHSPEAATKAELKFHISPDKEETVMDRIFASIS